MTHLFEQNHGARIVRQASPGAVSLKLQAYGFALSCSLLLSVTEPFSVSRCAPSTIPAPAAIPPKSRSAGSPRRRWSG
ncbi:hypothetical protein BW686_13955 [Pseudomonas syringae]|uniref:Uncharacterized protein n=1 Tax=Pseudomonas syringae TaxID=317 RepID=A0A244EPZ1_PSESX|nr:hypothetical protein BW686_13955 [Pseudomonas syringae]